MGSTNSRQWFLNYLRQVGGKMTLEANPGGCMEVIGISDLRKSLKEFRSAIASFDLFTQKKAKA
jgi:hypothetical protein